MLTASLTKFAVFNWTNPALRDWWVYTYVGGALNESAIDGVYLDCACRPPLGDRLPGSFQADAQLAVNAALLLATSLGKSINTWNPNAGLAHGSSEPAAAAGCANAVRTAISLGNDTRFTFQVRCICCALSLCCACRSSNPTFLAHQPSFRGMGAPKSVTPQAYNNTIAAFLLARGESALLEYPPTASPGDIL